MIAFPYRSRRQVRQHECGDLDLYLLSPILRNHLSRTLWCLQTSPPASAVPSD
jgi:hypothetical protein